MSYHHIESCHRISRGRASLGVPCFSGLGMCYGPRFFPSLCSSILGVGLFPGIIAKHATSKHRLCLSLTLSDKQGNLFARLPTHFCSHLIGQNRVTSASQKRLFLDQSGPPSSPETHPKCGLSGRSERTKGSLRIKEGGKDGIWMETSNVHCGDQELSHVIYVPARGLLYISLYPMCGARP